MKRINSGKLSIVYIDGEKIKRLLIDSHEFKTRKEIVKYLEQKWEIKINKENLLDAFNQRNVLSLEPAKCQAERY